MIAHIVLFEPKPTLTVAERRAFATHVVAAMRSIGGIDRISVGRSIDVSPGYERSMGDTTYEFAAVLEFADRDALVSYLRHPAHSELGAEFWRCCERTVVSEVQLEDIRSDSAVDLLV